MNKRKPERLCLLLLCALLVAAQLGCAQVSYDNPSMKLSPPPLPTSPPAPEPPVGDSVAEYISRQTLYAVSPDGRSLIEEQTDVKVETSQSLAEAIMERLLLKDEVIPQGTRLLSIEQSMGLMTVNLSLDALNIPGDEQSANLQMVSMKAMIVKTMCQLPGVSWVSVLFGGRDDGTMMLPGGALGPPDNDLLTLAGTLQAESDRFFDPYNEQPQLERFAALYFASPEMKLLIPEVRAIELTGNKTDAIVAALISELTRGPSDQRARSLLPEDAQRTQYLARTVTDSAGKRVVRITLADELADYMEEMDISPYMVYGSLILTITSFVPEVDGVALYIGDTPVESIQIDASADNPMAAYSQNGVFSRDELTGVIGLPARLYMTDANDAALMAQDRTMRLNAFGVPRALLHALIEGPLPGEEHLYPVVPEGIGANDILGISVRGDTVLVNLSSNFYRCCQSLSAAEERNLVFAMVNTLTEDPQIRRVRFFVEGAVVDTLVGSIHLRGELMRNPGLIRP